MTKMQSLMGWIDARLPVTKMWKEHMSEYYAPKNFNFWYFFGSLALLVLVIQIVTGIFLTMYYKPDSQLAFGSVEFIMRDVNWGWLIRYMHSTGASAFFIVVYLHMFRGLLYGSYKGPRELIWIFGVLIYLVLMGEAFFGYLLPWGQMSFWGAQVIVNLFSTIPFIGPDLSVWIRGDFVVSDATLNRFFAFHVIALPLVLLGLVVAHVLALHETGSSNPDGVEIKKNKDANGIPLDGIPLHPYYTIKDILGVVIFLMVYFFIIFFKPEGGGFFLEHPNFEPANALKTPPHIAPVWYFTPFYAILRAVPSMFASAFPGVVAMGASIVVMFFLPWLDRSPVRSMRYKGKLSFYALMSFVVVFITLGYMGVVPTTPNKTMIAQAGTMIYFAFFLFMPVYSNPVANRGLPRMVGVTISGLFVVGASIMWIVGFMAGDHQESFGTDITALFISVLAIVGFYTAFMIVPTFVKAEKTKPVPERVTFK